MNFQLGSNQIFGAWVPLLWGTRAVLQDNQRRISVIECSSNPPRLEILWDSPAAEIEYTPTMEDGGVTILGGGRQLYSYNPGNKALTSITLGLPECQILEDGIRVGTNIFSGNVTFGSAIGFHVTQHGVGMGANFPPELGRLMVR
ncbi:MAG: hypothetical protein HY040_18925 [Planctomycetes bacterium]|nr:hypothetical protein [Planctomycetota bacterium]